MCLDRAVQDGGLSILGVNSPFRRLDGYIIQNCRITGRVIYFYSTPRLLTSADEIYGIIRKPLSDQSTIDADSVRCFDVDDDARLDEQGLFRFDVDRALEDVGVSRRIPNTGNRTWVN